MGLRAGQRHQNPAGSREEGEGQQHGPARAVADGRDEGFKLWLLPKIPPGVRMQDGKAVDHRAQPGRACQRVNDRQNRVDAHLAKHAGTRGTAEDLRWEKRVNGVPATGESSNVIESLGPAQHDGVALIEQGPQLTTLGSAESVPLGEECFRSRLFLRRETILGAERI
jgi:hypothetical protein